MSFGLSGSFMDGNGSTLGEILCNKILDIFNLLPMNRHYGNIIKKLSKCFSMYREEFRNAGRLSLTICLRIDI